MVTLAAYRDVLRLPGVARLVLFAIVARIPNATTGLVLTLHVVTTLDRGYAAAGLVAAATTVGMALGGPWRGRVVDRVGLRRAVLPSVVSQIVVWAVAPWLPYAWLVAAAFVAGILAVPTFSIVRQAMAALVPAERRRVAFALDSIGVEISFVIGPALGVLVATQVSARAAVLMVGAALVAAGVGLMVMNPPTRAAETDDCRLGLGVEAPRRVAGIVPSWCSPALLGVLAASLAAMVVLAGSEVSMVAVLRAHDAVDLTGVVMAFWSGASLLGGVVYGAARREVSPAALLLWLSLLCLPVGLAVGPWSLALLILPTGALCAPLVSATAEAVSRLVPDGAGAEAMGWHGSAMTVGSALGAPLAGAMIDGVGPGGGFAVAGCLGAVLAVVVLMTSRRVAATSHGGPAERAELRPTPDEDRDREPARA